MVEVSRFVTWQRRQGDGETGRQGESISSSVSVSLSPCLFADLSAIPRRTASGTRRGPSGSSSAESSVILIRAIQPSPYGSLLSVSRLSGSDSLTAITSPVTGA